MKIKLLTLLLFFFCFSRVRSQSVGGVTSGAATYCTYTNSGFVSVSGSSGNIAWQESVNGGAWTYTGSTVSVQSYFNLDTTVCYRAVVTNGAFPADTSTVVCITIFAPSDAGTITGGGTFCASSGPGTLTLSGNIGGVVNWMSSTDAGATWTNIANTTPTLNYAGVTQNTLYTVIVQNTGACVNDTATPVSFIIDAPSVAGTVSAGTSTCPGIGYGSLTLSGITGSVTNWLGSTDGGVTWTTIPNTTTTQNYSSLFQSTTYAAVVQNASCPADTSTSSTITVFPVPIVAAGMDTTIDAGQTVALNGSGSGTPFWLYGSTLSSATIFNPVASPLVTTPYVLTVTDANSCVNADTVVVTVHSPLFNGLVSSYFSPNGDGINDTWFIENIQAYTDSEVSVYNIYGQQVYNKKGYANDWKGTYNGSDLPDGTYYYVLTLPKQSKVVKGSVDILHKK